MCFFPTNPVKALNPVAAIKNPKRLINPKTFVSKGGPKTAVKSALGDLKTNVTSPKSSLLG